MMLTVPELRRALGLPVVRPLSVRDLLVVARETGAPIPPADSWRLALGDWPDLWRSGPSVAPRFLVMLDGLAAPFFVATIETVDACAWGLDTDASPDCRVVPVTGTECQVTAVVAGAQVECDSSFGWVRPEEQYAFW
jgi:hypothetical protein